MHTRDPREWLNRMNVKALEPIPSPPGPDDDVLPVLYARHIMLPMVEAIVADRGRFTQISHAYAASYKTMDFTEAYEALVDLSEQFDKGAIAFDAYVARASDVMQGAGHALAQHVQQKLASMGRERFGG